MHLQPASITTMMRNIDSMLSNINTADRKRVVSVALGRAIAVNLPLPTVQLTISPEHHFDMNLMNSLNDLIAPINEVYLLDFGLVQQTAKMYYCFRYRTVYDPTMFMDLFDKLILWSDEILPNNIKDLALAVQSRPEFNPDILRLVEYLQITIKEIS